MVTNREMFGDIGKESLQGAEVELLVKSNSTNTIRISNKVSLAIVTYQGNVLETDVWWLERKMC